MDGFDILAAAGVVVLAVGLSMLAPEFAWIFVGATMVGTGLYGARASVKAEQQPDGDEPS